MIKRSLFAATIMTQALMASHAHAGVLDLFSKPVKVSTEKVQNVYSGIKFTYLDREDRLLIVNDFLKTVELEYALLPLKEKRVGLDFSKLKEEAVDAEMAAGDFTISAADRKNEDVREKIAFLQATSNMEFLDRMQVLVAKFKDTHFGIAEKITRPFIYNGLRFFRVQGKIVIGSMDEKFLSMVEKLSESDLSSLKIGDEVVSIDGVEVDKKVDELKAYIAGSSDEYVDMEAVRSLTLRNFKYEKKNYMKIAFKNGSVFKLPLFVNDSMQETPRLDAITYFKKYDIPLSSASIGISFDKATAKWVDSGLTFRGYSARNLKENLKAVVEMVDDSGAPAIRTGYYMNKGKVYAVMQLLTFYTKNVKTVDTEMPFLEAIRNFALDAKENGLPVIIDLRVNGGGNGNYPAAVLGIFTEADKTYGSPTHGFRVTTYARNLQDLTTYQRVPGEDQSVGMTIDDVQAIIDDAINEGRVYSPMFSLRGPVKADSKVKGFNQKMAVLITPNCISACDMTAFLFKDSKRATIIGTASNGTGAGFQSTSELNTKWEDRLRVVSTTIPNFLFGLPGKDLSKSVSGPDSVDDLCSENRPTIADVQYSNTPLDIMKGNLGWLQKAAQVIEEQK